LVSCVRINLVSCVRNSWVSCVRSRWARCVRLSLVSCVRISWARRERMRWGGGEGYGVMGGLGCELTRLTIRDLCTYYNCSTLYCICTLYCMCVFSYSWVQSGEQLKWTQSGSSSWSRRSEQSCLYIQMLAQYQTAVFKITCLTTVCRDKSLHSLLSI